MTENASAEHPQKSKKQKIELIILVVMVAALIAIGVPAYRDYQNLEKAIALFEAGDECLHHNDSAGAKAKFEEAIATFPGLRGAYEELAALAWFEDHDYDEACRIYDNAVKAMPDSPDIYLSYSRFMFTTCHYEKARDLAQKAVDLDPEDAIHKNHLDLFTKMCNDPEMVKRHQQIRAKMGEGVDMPGSHHHMHNHADEAGHAEAEHADAHHAESQPAEAQPAEAQPAEAQPAEAQPAEAQPAEAQPAEAQPAEAQPAEAQPAEAQPAK